MISSEAPVAAHTRALLPRALAQLPELKRTRKIFFVERWLEAFLGGQADSSALDNVRQFLREHPGLPLDLRQKILQNADELARTVRIRAKFK